jgi:predicted nucleic acid-binding protein
VKVYLETGIFIDYLSSRGMAQSLRIAPRRGRGPGELSLDAEMLLQRVAASHVGATSVLTCYEVEEAIHHDLAKVVKGVSIGELLIIAPARALMTQTVTALEYFGIQLLSLTADTIDHQLQTLELQKRGVRAADALHVTTAVDFNADIVVSTDDGILQLDGVLRNQSGHPMRCVDSDTCLSLL